MPLSPSLSWYVVSTMRAERIREGTSRRSDMDSAPKAWPSEVRSFLGPIQDSPPTGVPSRGSSASTAAVSAQGVREALPAHPPPGAILQPGVPCGGTPVAAKASQPAVPHNGQWPRETPVPEPPVPMSLRRSRREAEAEADHPMMPDVPCECAMQGCEGQRAAEESGFFFCDRPGCEEHFTLSKRSPCQRFCSSSCRQALRRVMERERRWRQRSRRTKRHRPTGRGRGP